ncbi:response regulator [Clostridium botulinum]|nr:response regulator [Clostridium botulinum]NFO91327.1 response regulator [Clostridium botulinum]
MKLLIVEDNKNKLNQVEEWVKKIYDNIEVHEAISYTSGIRKIYEEDWDLILLDMSLPTYDITPQESGGDKKPTAGKEIMKRMLHRKIITPVIVITQFETFGENELSINTLNEEFKKSLIDVWKGTINYDDTKSTWKVELKTLLTEILGEKND